MKKIVFVFLIAVFLLTVGCTAVKADSSIDPNLLPDNSKYVGEATVWVTVYGDTVTSKPYRWTAWEVLWPGADCFVNGVKTVKITGLLHKEGYHWEKNNNTYCIVKD